ncbi:MAG: hypothetical protein PHO32_09140 [Candidatus Cloacimonetes bacterium]|nr:hypothetical protein [Candidatus Cloacimonadota bacterium]
MATNNSLSSITNKKSFWIWIIVGLILFWPVGLGMLILKLKNDRSATMNGIFANVISFVGWCLVIFGVLVFIACVGVPEAVGAGIFSFLLLGGGGFVMLRLSKKMKSRGSRYKKMINLVVNQKQTSIDNIASAVGLPYDDVVADLQTMINSHYFPGASIDSTNREIILPIISTAPKEEYNHQAGSFKVVSCSSCGANNTVTLGMVVPCDYCGAPLS